MTITEFDASIKNLALFINQELASGHVRDISIKAQTHDGGSVTLFGTDHYIEEAYFFERMANVDGYVQGLDIHNIKDFAIQESHY